LESNPRFFYLLSFIEGASVMAAELIGAKMLAPYFGSSLYVWSAVMAVTLGGLALGYFCGGHLSYRRKGPQVLYGVMFIASLLVIIMPFSSKLVLAFIGTHALMPSVIASTVIFLMPPILMMGMVSPLIILQVTTGKDHSGKAAGTVYAISTVGGIIATFLTGFWIIPNFGLSRPCVLIGIFLGILPLCMMFRKNKIAAIYFIALASWSLYKTASFETPAGVRIPYHSEGLLGQLMVVDYPNYKADGSSGEGTYRLLFANRIMQTQTDDKVDSLKHFGYVDKILKNISSFPKTSSILVCGLGGGSLVEELRKTGFRVEACELDSRIEYVARTYFGLDKSVRVTIDDARHFIKTTPQKFDILILDLFRGEENPGHCFSLEAFEEMKKILMPEGLLIINGNGFVTGLAGAGNRSLFQTMKTAGFEVCTVPTRRDEAWRNLVYFAQLQGGRRMQQIFEAANAPGELTVSSKEFASGDYVVMTDDRPVLDQLNAEAYRRWRIGTIYYFENEAQRGRRFPVFQ
jgi:predicted membrane-bound spermidine synthase